MSSMKNQVNRVVAVASSVGVLLCWSPAFAAPGGNGNGNAFGLNNGGGNPFNNGGGNPFNNGNNAGGNGNGNAFGLGGGNAGGNGNGNGNAFGLGGGNAGGNGNGNAFGVGGGNGVGAGGNGNAFGAGGGNGIANGGGVLNNPVLQNILGGVTAGGSAGGLGSLLGSGAGGGGVSNALNNIIQQNIGSAVSAGVLANIQNIANINQITNQIQNQLPNNQLNNVLGTLGLHSNNQFGNGIFGPGHDPNAHSEGAPGHGYDVGPGMGPGNGNGYGHNGPITLLPGDNVNGGNVDHGGGGSGGNSHAPGPGGYGINGPGHITNWHAEDAPGHGYDLGPGMGPGNGLAYGHWGGVIGGGGGGGSNGGGTGGAGGGGSGGNSHPPGPGGYGINGPGHITNWHAEDAPGHGYDLGPGMGPGNGLAYGHWGGPGGGGGGGGGNGGGGGGGGGNGGGGGGGGGNGGGGNGGGGGGGNGGGGGGGNGGGGNGGGGGGGGLPPGLVSQLSVFGTVRGLNASNNATTETDSSGPSVAIDNASNRGYDRIRLLPYGFNQDDESLILADQNAEFTADNDHHLTLKKGTLVILTGQRAIGVTTPLGEVTVPDNSAGGVASRHGDVKVASLQGQEIAFDATYKGKDNHMQVANHREVDVTANQVATAGTSDFVPSLDRMASAIPGLNMSNSSIAESNLFFDRLAKADKSIWSPTLRNRVRALVSEMVAANHLLVMPRDLGQQSGNGATSIGLSSHYRPIAFTSFGAYIKPSMMDEVKNVDGELAKVSYCGDADVGTDSANALIVNGGEVLIQPKQNIKVMAGEVSLAVPKDAVVMVSRFGAQTNAKVLWDTAANSVKATVGDQTIGMMVGHEISVRKAGTPSERYLDRVARRKVASSSSKECVVTTGEFSIVSALQNNPMLRKMVKSQERSAKQLSGRLLKVAVCLAYSTGSHGAYTMAHHSE